jgi:TFIIF-interacting CTD phosphatase-like protein
MKRVVLSTTLILLAPCPLYIGHLCMRQDKEMHLVFDLDQTLVQTAYSKAHENFNNSNVRSFDNTIKCGDACYYVWHRPFAHWTLVLLDKFCHLHLFTAAKQDYADACLEPFPNVFQSKHYRESTGNKGAFGKNLELMNLPIDKSILIDDQKRNNHQGQSFYHIPPYIRHVTVDLEMLKLGAWVVLQHAKRDFKCTMSQIQDRFH